MLEVVLYHRPTPVRVRVGLALRLAGLPGEVERSADKRGQSSSQTGCRLLISASAASLGLPVNMANTWVRFSSSLA
jgi:hypothetical protein